MNWNAIKEQYVQLIEEDFVPYWSKFIDPEYGGILNCISNDGKQQISDQKFSWSQGRYAWILAELLELTRRGVLSKTPATNFATLLQETKSFLLNHCITEEYHAFYLTDRQGTPLAEPRTGLLEASIFSDCFVVSGLANAIRVTGNTQGLDTLAKLYHTVVDRILSRTFVSEPYPIGEEYQSHSIPMILDNTSVEYAKCIESLLAQEIATAEGVQLAEEAAFAQDIEAQCCAKIKNEFYNPETGLIREFVSNDENYEKRLLDRHVNPGHSIEDTWFLLEHYQRADRLAEELPWVENMAINSYRIGWDPEYGGLLRFVDRDGGQPRGERTTDTFEELLVNTWDMKLWWPHSETLYTFLLLHSLSENEEPKAIYEEASEYIFRTFPNPEVGEWAQIRDRTGKPEEKVVALPVKDPYHILRNFIRIVQLADRMTE